MSTWETWKNNMLYLEKEIPDAQLMIIGEAPGKDEDEQGIPFIGRSGKLLTKILTSLGIDRKEIFITNSVKCRPPENRKPTTARKQNMQRYLAHQSNQHHSNQKSSALLDQQLLKLLLEKPVKM